MEILYATFRMGDVIKKCSVIDIFQNMGHMKKSIEFGKQWSEAWEVGGVEEGEGHREALEGTPLSCESLWPKEAFWVC